MINRQSIELNISWKQPKIAQHLAMQRDTNLIFTFAWFLKPNMGWQIIGLADYQSKYLAFLLFDISHFQNWFTDNIIKSIYIIFLSEPLLFLILTFIFIFTPDINRFKISVYWSLICNNRSNPKAN